MQNKGQIDMFGLVIIVVLIVFIALFALFFMSKTSSDEGDVYYSLKAYNFANALSKSSVDNTNMESLILSCCQGFGGSCDVVLNFAQNEFKKLDFTDGSYDKLAKFELYCKYEEKPFSRGECNEGVVSESIILPSQDSIRVILCRK